MIAKLSTGNGFGGATSYLLRNGESDEERAKVKILAAVGVDYSVNENGNIILDSRQVARDFRFQSMMIPSVRKPVYDIALSWKVGEHVPSDEKLARTEEFLQMIGFDNTQYVIVEHKKDNEHSHAIANIVDNDGNRISTKDLIDRMHAAAREITQKYGYQWGESAKKETIEKAHKPHEKARYTIEPKVKAAVAEAKDIQDLPGLLNPSGINCRIKYSDAGKPVGISFSVELDGQLHTFRGSDLDRSLSAGNIVKTIDGRLAQEESNRIAAAALQEQAKAEELRAVYRQMVATIRGLHKAVTDTLQLYSDTKQAGIAISAQTSQKYAELKQSWTNFRQLNRERKEATKTGAYIKSIGGMLMSLNPIVGILAILIGKIATDIRLSAIQYEKNALLTKIEGLKSDIDSLQQQKAQIKIEKQERLNDYLQAKDARNEFRQGMNTVKEEIDAIKRGIQIDELKHRFPFRAPGHIQYIVHSQTDASIFHAGHEDTEQYRKVPTGEYLEHSNGTRVSLTEDKIETARLMLKDKGYMVASDRGPDDYDGFYQSLLRQQKYENYRVGNMYIHADGKISFGSEEIFGDAKKTAPAFAREISERPQLAQVSEKKPVQTAPAAQPVQTPSKPNFEIVKTFTVDYDKFRIKKESDGTYKLQHLDWDKSSAVNGKYTKQGWYLKAKFTSFTEVAKDANGVYFKIKDFDTGKTRYINQHGTDLSGRLLQKLGLSGGKGYGGPHM